MQRVNIQKIRLTDSQSNSLKILKSYNINISEFIRQAIKEKLQKDWKHIKEPKQKDICPF